MEEKVNVALNIFRHIGEGLAGHAQRLASHFTAHVKAHVEVKQSVFAGVLSALRLQQRWTGAAVRPGALRECWQVLCRIGPGRAQRNGPVWVSEPCTALYGKVFRLRAGKGRVLWAAFGALQCRGAFPHVWGADRDQGSMQQQQQGKSSKRGILLAAHQRLAAQHCLELHLGHQKLVSASREKAGMAEPVEASHASELSVVMTLLALTATSKLFLAGLPVLILADVVDELIFQR